MQTEQWSTQVLDEHLSNEAARYLRGEMTPDETSQFEADIIENPALFEEVQYQEQLQEGMKVAYSLRERICFKNHIEGYIKKISWPAIALFFITPCTALLTYQHYKVNLHLQSLLVPSIIPMAIEANYPHDPDSGDMTYTVPSMSDRTLIKIITPTQDALKYIVTVRDDERHCISREVNVKGSHELLVSIQEPNRPNDQTNTIITIQEQDSEECSAYKLTHQQSKVLLTQNKCQSFTELSNLHSYTAC